MKSLHIDCSGYAVAADWYEGKGTSKILLSLCGVQSEKSSMTELTNSIVAETGSSALVFDYSGRGDSRFVFEEMRQAEHFLELVNVFDWIRESYPDAEITVMGYSYGGFLATHLTQYRAFTHLILRAPAIYKPSDFTPLGVL